MHGGAKSQDHGEKTRAGKQKMQPPERAHHVEINTAQIKREKAHAQVHV